MTTPSDGRAAAAPRRRKATKKPRRDERDERTADARLAEARPGACDVVDRLRRLTGAMRTQRAERDGGIVASPPDAWMARLEALWTTPGFFGAFIDRTWLRDKRIIDGAVVRFRRRWWWRPPASAAEHAPALIDLADAVRTVWRLTGPGGVIHGGMEDGATSAVPCQRPLRPVDPAAIAELERAADVIEAAVCAEDPADDRTARVDPQAGEVRVGSRRCELRGQALTLMHAIARRPGRWIDPGGLADLIEGWADAETARARLKGAARDLRAALRRGGLDDLAERVESKQTRGLRLRA